MPTNFSARVSVRPSARLCAILKSVLGGLLVLTGGCRDHAPRLDAEGDPCRTLYSFCADEETLMICEGEVWTPRHCDEYCPEQAPGVSGESCGRRWIDDLCLCEPPPEGCFPGASRCDPDDPSALWSCDGDWQWTKRSCAALCAAESPTASTLGCIEEVHPYVPEELVESSTATCICTPEGSPCDAEPPRCVSGTELRDCVAGEIVFVDCEVACSADQAPGRCDPQDPAAHRCLCTPDGS